MEKNASPIWPGHPYPHGATWDGEGVNFALFSQHAEAVELCLFDARGRHETERIALREQTDQVWHGYLPSARPGLIYGYRVYGPYQPEDGHRFNPHKLLLDPYAKQILGELRWSDAHFGYRIGHKHADLSFDQRDNAFAMPKAVVADTAFSWGDDRPPRIPWHNTVIMEAHVRGLTMRHPDIPPQLRGSYAAIAMPPIVEHLQRIGITALELMPVHAFIDERHLVDKGLRNYWGYNSIGYFAPHGRYSASGQLGEFQSMVRALHSAGIEVILDVVYNHTAEGNHLGPTLCFRGIDNAAYYRLVDDEPRYYMDYAGCGNTLDLRHPRVLQLVMDSLRYWVREMHVDGFRFDLAPALGRERLAADRLGPFFDILLQDPVLCQVKLIAEPWDLGEGGYQVGNFPVGWAEWNDRYRDAVRAYWKGDAGVIGDLAQRLSGSSDLYQSSGRTPYASINFVTAHDGFSLNDLVSYDVKHNEANQEENRDGSDRNLSWNCGAEGVTDDPGVNALRARQRRNFLATLLLSQGIPMLLAGDCMGRTQHGNNNAYCQDNESSWLDWGRSAEKDKLLAFARRIAALRRGHFVFRRRHFFHGRALRGRDVKDIVWLHPHGREMAGEDWNDALARCLGCYLAGEELLEMDEQGRALTDDSFLLLLNAHHETILFTLPGFRRASPWEEVFDTAVGDGLKPTGHHRPGSAYPLQGRSLALLVRRMKVR